MTVEEFARYSLAIPKDRHDEFNKMLSFVEDTVARRCRIVICRDCYELGEPFPRGDGYSHRRNGRDYRCHAEAIILEMAKVESSERTRAE
jgi:hypothetical protein